MRRIRIYLAVDVETTFSRQAVIDILMDNLENAGFTPRKPHRVQEEGE